MTESGHGAEVVSKTDQAAPEQRHYPRLQAPVYCSPVGLGIFQHRRLTSNISLGGLRIYSDMLMKKGSRMELELFLPDNTSLKCQVAVAWVTELPPGSDARFDVGFRLVDISEPDLQRIATVLQDVP